MDDHLAHWREGKDAAFRLPGQSPLTPGQLAAFDGLKYYAEATHLRFEVIVEPFPEPELVEMATSAGQPATYERYGLVRFLVDGRELQLTVFRDPQQEQWFLPFRDATSGAETYGAGRYIELEPASDDKLILDFNYAYNPFCAYNADWVCPLPPPDNRLPVPIRAGEKAFT